MIASSGPSFSTPAVDSTSVLRALDGDRKLAGQLAIIFCEDVPVLAKQLQESVAADNFSAARLAAHSIKGLSASMYAQQVVELAAAIEMALASERYDGTVQNQIEVLVSYLEQTISELRSLDWSLV